MSTGKIRRAQLVTPFGVGAMSVLVNGTNVITAGLDHWYEVADINTLALEEYVEHDWRLEARLRVKRVPTSLPTIATRGIRPRPTQRPAHRSRAAFPSLVFLHLLQAAQASARSPCSQQVKFALTRNTLIGSSSRACPRSRSWPCAARGTSTTSPSVKWVHRSLHPSCNGVLRLTSRGGGGLEGQVVTCDGCSKNRSLRGITYWRPDSNGEEQTTLTDQLSTPEDPYYCSGARPWLGKLSGTCGQPMRGALRAAGNVYFPKVESSIYLPRKEGAVSADLHELMRRPNVGPVMRVLHQAFGAKVTVDQLREHLPQELFAPIHDEELMAGFRDLCGVDENLPTDPDDIDAELLTGDDEWRYPEYQRIRETPRDDYLTATDLGLHTDLRAHLGRIRSVDVLRETRALRGFTRVETTSSGSPQESHSCAAAHYRPIKIGCPPTL